MSKMKKIAAVMLSLVMIVCLFSVGAGAAGSVYANAKEIQNGKTVSAKLKKAGKTADYYIKSSKSGKLKITVNVNLSVFGFYVYDVNGNYVNINIPAHGTRILVLTNGEAPEYPDGDTSSEPSQAAAPAEEGTPAPAEEGAPAPAEEGAPAQEQPKPLPAVGEPGRYRHFKGGEYEFVCLAKDSETSEELVIYKEVGGEGKVWARPSAIFYQYVDVDGKQVPRFEKID